MQMVGEIQLIPPQPVGTRIPDQMRTLKFKFCFGIQMEVPHSHLTEMATRQWVLTEDRLRPNMIVSDNLVDAVHLIASAETIIGRRSRPIVLAQPTLLPAIVTFERKVFSGSASSAIRSP